ncbi:MAG: GAF domain-containing protein [Janthinobacterium lividum]
MDSAPSTTSLPTPETEAQRDRHLVALHEVVGAVARQTDPRTTLSVIAEKARVLTNAASAAVSLLNASRTLLDFAAVAGIDAAQIVGQTVRVEDALAGRTALTGELYLVHHPDAAADQTNSADLIVAVGVGVRSAVVVPIYLDGNPSGALTILNRTDGDAFSGSDLLCLQTLASLAAQALRTDELKRLAAQKQQERDILFRAAQTTSSSLNVQEVLGSVLSTVVGSMEMTAGAVFLLNDERTRLYIGAERGLGEEDQDRQLPADGSGLAARALASGQPLRLNDVLADSTDDPPLPGMRSLLLAPMVARSVAEGMLVVGSRQPGAYSDADASLLSAVASQAAVALENAWLYEDATRRAQEAAALYELSQAVGATLNLNRVIHFVADSVLSLLHVDKFALFLYDSTANCLEIKVSRNIRRETAQTMKPKAGEGIAGWVLEFETPTAVQDVSADHRNRSCPIDGEGVTSLVSVPLQSGDQVIGVLHAMSSRRRLFTVGEMELLYTIANQVGAAIANARMYEDARQKSEEIRKGVRRIARALGSSLDGQQTAQTIADLALEMTGTDRGLLFAFDSQGNLSAQAASNFKSALAALPIISLADSGRGPETATAFVARRGRSLTIEDFAKDMRFVLPSFAARERITGYLGVPLKLGKEILGVLEVYTREPRRFTADEIRLMITFATQASVGLQNALLVEQASRRLDDLQALGALGALLACAAPPEVLFPAALRLLCVAAEAEAGVFQRFDDQNTSFVYCCENERPEENETRSEDLEALLIDLAGQVEAARDFDLVPSDHALPTLILPVPSQLDCIPRGVMILVRGPRRRSFNSHERRLAVTASNLLSPRLS